MSLSQNRVSLSKRKQIKAYLLKVYLKDPFLGAELFYESDCALVH